MRVLDNGITALFEVVYVYTYMYMICMYKTDRLLYTRLRVIIILYTLENALIQIINVK